MLFGMVILFGKLPSYIEAKWYLPSVGIMMLKQRIFAVLMTLISSAILYWTWYDARHNGGYYLKAATFAPVGITFGLFLFVFPQYGGKPKTTRERIITLSVFALGLVFGLYNWYLIDPGNFLFSGN